MSHVKHRRTPDAALQRRRAEQPPIATFTHAGESRGGDPRCPVAQKRVWNSPRQQKYPSAPKNTPANIQKTFHFDYPLLRKGGFILNRL